MQISETQRVQIDVGVQHRQVYAGFGDGSGGIEKIWPCNSYRNWKNNCPIIIWSWTSSRRNGEDPGAEEVPLPLPTHDRSESKEFEGREDGRGRPPPFRSRDTEGGGVIL